MAISFLSDANATIDVYLTFDASIELTDEDRSIYLTEGVFKGTAKDDATKFTLKALSPAEREEAEMQAGSYTRSELGRLLWTESPNDEKEKAQWQHSLSTGRERSIIILSSIYKPSLS